MKFFLVLAATGTQTGNLYELFERVMQIYAKIYLLICIYDEGYGQPIVTEKFYPSSEGNYVTTLGRQIPCGIKSFQDAVTFKQHSLKF